MAVGQWVAQRSGGVVPMENALRSYRGQLGAIPKAQKAKLWVEEKGDEASE